MPIRLEPVELAVMAPMVPMEANPFLMQPVPSLQTEAPPGQTEPGQEPAGPVVQPEERALPSVTAGAPAVTDVITTKVPAAAAGHPLLLYFQVLTVATELQPVVWAVQPLPVVVTVEQAVTRL